MTIHKLFVTIIILSLILLSFQSPLEGSTYNVGDNELMFMPTAETMPKGSFSVSNYEIFFFNASYGLAPSTQIGANFTLSGTSIYSLSIKQRVINKNRFKVSGFLTIFPSGIGLLAGGIITTGDEDTQLNLGAGFLTNFDEIDIWTGNFLMVGFKQKIFRKGYFIVEYYNQFNFNFGGLGLAGVRFLTNNNKWAFDLGVIYGIISDTDDVQIFPYLKISFQIK